MPACTAALGEGICANRAWLPLQVESFSQGLRSHQKAVTADGTTVLEKAVIEHNLAAAARLYNNIYFAELGQLLGVSPDQAEIVACRMIAEERLKVTPSPHPSYAKVQTMTPRAALEHVPPVYGLCPLILLCSTLRQSFCHTCLTSTHSCAHLPYHSRVAQLCKLNQIARIL